MKTNFKTKLFYLLKKDSRLWDEEKKELNETLLKDLIDKLDEKLIELLLNDDEINKKFFIKVKNVFVLKQNELKFFIDENKLDNSCTQYYQNKIGLKAGNKLLSDRDEVVLEWPFKDCVLEGGMTKEDQKRNEIFFNEILAKDEIDRLEDPKALVNWKRYSKEGEQEIKELKRDEYGTIKENMIIKGNNLLALHCLRKQFIGKIKLIYIDPPYNTGNDGFKYNDNYNHSTWLTFMKNRLKVAGELLRDDGFIFVQCDDNEQAYLKVLMDEVFGRDNFLNVVSARMKNIAGASGGGEDKRLKKNIEFINIFAKNYNNSRLENAYEYTEIWKLIEDYKRKNISWKYTSVVIDYGKKEYIKSTKDGEGNEIKIYKRVNPLFKSISQIALEEKISKKEVYYKYIDRIFTTAMPQSSIRTRVLESLRGEKDTDFISIEYTPKSGKNKDRVYEQYYKGEKLRLLAWLKDVVEKINEELYKRDLQGTLWEGFNLNNLSKEGDTVFKSGKKPEELIKKVLDISTKENDIVLDYHLGSGTTTAVAHKMKRQYIGIEQLDYGENDSIVRQKKVIAGEQGGISKSIKWQGGGNFVYFELAKWNEEAKEKFLKAKNFTELKKLFNELYEKYFLNYNVKTKEFKEKIINEGDFKKLELDKQKRLFVEMLDMNQMYVNFSERADSKYKLFKEDIALSEDFYNVK